MNPAQASSLARVSRGNLCSGCGGCALLAPEAIRMEMTPPGFLRPVQHAPIAAETDATIAAICPGLGQRVEAGSRQDDVLWGPFLDTVTGWSTDPELRHRASSGGALSAVLVHLVESGAVDGIVHTGAGRPAVANAPVISRTRAEVIAAAGSRYAPSAPLAGLDQHLQGDARLALVGKPCDIAALRALAARDPRIDARFPYMISFFCGGVPSQGAAERLLDAMDAPRDHVTGFRYRGMGWPGLATATLADGSERTMSYADSWGQILSKTVQLRCKICADGTGTAADLVCADAWEADERGYPLFDEAPGISLITARSPKGQDLLASAKAAGQIETRPFDMGQLTKIQPGQTRRREAVLARLCGLAITGRPYPRYHGLHLRAAAARIPIMRHLQSFAGMVSRVLKKRV